MPRRCAEGPQYGWQPDPHSPSVVNYINQGLDEATLGTESVELAGNAISAGVAGIKDGTSVGGTYNMDGTTYDGGGLSVGVSSLPKMTAKQITDEKVETFRQKFMQGHKPWEKIGLFKFPEDRYASVDFTLILPKERLELAKKLGIYTRQHSNYDIENDSLI